MTFMSESTFIPEPVRALCASPPGFPPGTEALLSELVGLVLAGNEAMNLTSDREPGLQWSRHIEDALINAAFIRDEIGMPEEILDAGSGGGIPGLVWPVVWPGVDVTLLESQARKAGHLERTALALGRSRVRVVCERAETFGRMAAERERFGLVTARALAPMPVLLELCLPLVRIGGRLLAIKGANPEEEIAAAAEAARTLGAAPPRVGRYVRSDGGVGHHVVYEKIAYTPDKYPRRPGVPFRRPLQPRA